jgi:hypothetical protein
MQGMVITINSQTLPLTLSMTEHISLQVWQFPRRDNKIALAVHEIHLLQESSFVSFLSPFLYVSGTMLRLIPAL